MDPETQETCSANLQEDFDKILACGALDYAKQCQDMSRLCTLYSAAANGPFSRSCNEDDWSDLLCWTLARKCSRRCPIKPRTAKSWPYHAAVQGGIVRSSCTWPWPHLSECTRLTDGCCVMQTCKLRQKFESTGTGGSPNCRTPQSVRSMRFLGCRCRVIRLQQFLQKTLEVRGGCGKGDAGLNTLQKSSEYCDEMHDQCATNLFARGA